MILTSILSIALAVLTIVGRWQIFERIGDKGWKSLIPIYSDYVYAKNTSKSAVKDFWCVLGGCLLEFLGLMLAKPTKLADGTVVFNLSLSENPVAVVLFAFGIVAILVFSFMMYKKFFAKHEVGAGWALLMVLIPAIPTIYFGLCDKTTAAFNRSPVAKS
jgi:hypothetical protein